MELHLLATAPEGGEGIVNECLEKNRGFPVPGHASYDTEEIEVNDEVIKVNSFIRLLDCPDWPKLKHMLVDESHTWLWSPDRGDSLPVNIYFRSSYRSLQQYPKVYQRALTELWLGPAETSPSPANAIWDQRFDDAIVEPMRHLVNELHKSYHPEEDWETFIPWFLQLSKYWGKQSKRDSHHDARDYEYIAGCNIKNHATISLRTGRCTTVWSQPVGEGEMYLLAGHGIRPWQHKVECHGESERIVAIVRFIRLSKLQPCILQEEKAANLLKQTRSRYTLRRS